MKVVHMIYTGIIALIRDPRDGSFYACMPETRKEDEKRNHKEDMRHYPHLAIESENLVSTNLRPLKSHAGQIAYDIDGLAMAIASPITSSLLSESTEFFLPLEYGCAPSAPNCSKVNGEILHGPSSSLVAACTTLRRGVLEATYVDRWYKWRFVEPPTEPPMWIAQEITHTFEISESMLRLSFGNGRGLIVEAPGDEDIEARVGHTLWDDIFPEGTDEDPPKDEHVKMYHDLSAVPTPEDQRRMLDWVKQDDALSEPPQDLDKNKFRLGGAAVAELKERRRVGGSNCPPSLMSF